MPLHLYASTPVRLYLQRVNDCPRSMSTLKYLSILHLIPVEGSKNTLSAYPRQLDFFIWASNLPYGKSYFHYQIPEKWQVNQQVPQQQVEEQGES